jgi:alkylhydroperoxidase family enzyme
MTQTTPLETRITPLDSDALADRFGAPAGGPTPARPLNIFLTMARNPELLKGFGRLGRYLLSEGKLPARERELVILRVGWRCGSEYEFGQHTVIGRRAGLTDDEIARIAAEDSHGWSDEDDALLRLCDELCADDVVSDPTWTALSANWDDAQLLELLVLAGYYRLVSGMLNSAGVPLEAQTPGWPDGAAVARRAPRDVAQ